MDQEDILLEIFSWLPKRSRLRCKAVCKRWQSLIKESAPFFAAFACRRIDQCGSLLLIYESEVKRMRLISTTQFGNKGCELVVHEHAIDVKLIIGPICWNASSHNPVVLYCTREELYTPRTFHVYNPLTVLLPHHSVINIPPMPVVYRVSPFPFCMGYVPCSATTSTHFKFVVATYQVRSYSLRAHIRFSIFDSETGIWETEPPNRSGRPTDGRNLLGFLDFSDACPPCVSLQGDIFWLRVSCIFAFRLKAWTLRRTQLPHHPRQHRGRFWESDGGRRLKYCQIVPTTYYMTGYYFCIWVLDEPLQLLHNGENYKWRMIFALSLDALNSKLLQAGREPFNPRYTRVSAFDEDEGILHLEAPQGRLSYDITGKTFFPTSVSSYSKRSGSFLGHQPFTACNKLVIND